MGIDINKLSAIKVGLASPSKITEWSHGEVTKPETWVVVAKLNK